MVVLSAEQRSVDERIKNQYQDAQAVYQACKKKLDELAQGKTGSSIMADIELT
jgi:hypothetical protein